MRSKRGAWVSLNTVSYCTMHMSHHNFNNYMNKYVMWWIITDDEQFFGAVNHFPHLSIPPSSKWEVIWYLISSDRVIGVSHIIKQLWQGRLCVVKCEIIKNMSQSWFFNLLVTHRKWNPVAQGDANCGSHAILYLTTFLIAKIQST